MPSMAAPPLLAAALLILAGCGGSGEVGRDDGELRLLVPPGYADERLVERETDCTTDIRVYDETEDVVALARRRDVDAIAGSERIIGALRKADELLPGTSPVDMVEYVEARLEGGVVITLPRDLASAFDTVSTRSVGRRTTVWVVRKDADNRICAEQWIAHAISR